MRPLSFLGFGLLMSSLVPSAKAQLVAPITCDDCIAGWFYFDHDASGAAQDWQCEASTYDGHRGSDFSLRGGNSAIDGAHEVVAAGSGTVESAVDGFYDRCTECGGANCGVDFGTGYGNHVIVRHGDLRVVYGHLRMGSVRVAPGDTVGCGQVLANIGSSGCSTGAHLHFEVRPMDTAATNAFDPFEGACSAASRSSWLVQGIHRGLPSDQCPPECLPGEEGVWRCGTMARMRCVAGETQSEACPFGCEVVRDEAMCNGAPRCRDGLDEDWVCDGDDRIRCVGVSEERESCVRCDASQSQAVCSTELDSDGDGSPDSVDCADRNPAIFPGAIEVCGDGVDQDCDGGDVACTDGGVGERRLLTGGCAIGGMVENNATNGLLGWLGLLVFAAACRRRALFAPNRRFRRERRMAAP